MNCINGSVHVETDNTWALMNIVKNFNKRVQSIDTYTSEYERLEDLYAQAIRLQCVSKYSYGDIMVKEDFIRCVESGSFIDYDGQGIFLDYDGNDVGGLYCDVEFLKKFDHPFVAWFNK